MLFQTYEFLILIACVVAGLLALRRAGSQHVMLLVASYVFYGWWDVRFLMLILLSTVIDYAAGLGMSGIKLSGPRRVAISGVLLAGVALFLLPDWNALQHGEGPVTLGALVGAPSAGTWWAIVAASAFAIIGPLLYGWYFALGETARRRAFLVTSIVANLGMLAFFKYFNFFTDNLVGVGELLGMHWEDDIGSLQAALQVALPVGISFYTFQTMSYTIDAYRGKIEAEHSFLRMALYVSYFPQLVAGPILRPQQFLPTLNEAWTLRRDNVVSGINLAAVGLFKKVLIADSVAPLVNTILADPQGQPSLVIIIATALFAIQIYCDFSGYTDIARGVSRMFGVEIPLNFNFPYFSTSIIEFWRRWHISLSSWLRDYLYIPLGGSRGSSARTYFNLMATMVLGGLWHGAAWNFVIWGAYQGVLLCINRLLRTWLERRPALERALTGRPGTVVRWAVTAYLWLLGWLIFRVGDFHDLWYCMQRYVLLDFRMELSGLGLGRGAPFTAMLAALLFCVLHAWGFFGRRWGSRLDALPAWLLAIVYAALGAVFFFGWPSSNEPFIYFQF